MGDILYFVFIAIAIVVSIVRQANKGKKPKSPAAPAQRTVQPQQKTGGKGSVEDMIREILEAQELERTQQAPKPSQAASKPKPAPTLEPQRFDGYEPLEKFSNDQELEPSYEFGSYEDHTILHSLDHAKEHKRKRAKATSKKRIKALGNRPFNGREAIIMSEILNRKF